MAADMMPTSRSEAHRPPNQWWRDVKRQIRQALHASPPAEALAERTWRNTRFRLLTLAWKLAAWIGGWLHTHVRDTDFDQIYWISPEKIVFSSLREFSITHSKGRLMGGDWDHLEKRFDSLDLYMAIKQVCVEGKSWTDTVYYQRVLEGQKKGRDIPGFKDEAGLQRACKAMESLYHEIQREGYKTQRELFLAGRIEDPLVAQEEIAVSIGRFGDVLFSDGAHRLAIAKLLKLPSIPVKIAVRHKGWIAFKDELARYARETSINKSRLLYQPVTHPDLREVPAFHACTDRFQLIRDHTSSREGRLLDIGANLGYFCHRFEEQGFDCYAVENDRTTAYFLRRLARAENRKFKVIEASILDAPQINAIQFDVVLALNIFHHFFKTQEEHDKLIEFLKNINMKEMFFEPHQPGEQQMHNAYRDYSPEESVAFITRHSMLKNAVLLSVMSDGRSLYKIY